MVSYALAEHFLDGGAQLPVAKLHSAVGTGLADVLSLHVAVHWSKPVQAGQVALVTEEGLPVQLILATARHGVRTIEWHMLVAMLPCELVVS